MTIPVAIEAALAAERRRAGAVVARDLAQLEVCLHDELVYVHATGLRHGKAELLRVIAEGPLFIAVELQADYRAEIGPAALLHGPLTLQLRRPGESETVMAWSWASALWLPDAAGRWQLRMFQSTKLAS